MGNQFSTPWNYENLLYLNPGNFIFDLSSSPGLSSFENEFVIEFLNFEINDFPNLSLEESSKLKQKYIDQGLDCHLLGFDFYEMNSNILEKHCFGG